MRQIFVRIVCYSFGDGITFPQRLLDEDTDRLLGGRQRWAEEDSPSHQGMILLKFY